MPKVDLQALKARVHVSTVLRGHVELKAHGDELKGLCPFHKEDTPSFTVFDGDARFRCFGCGAQGDVLDALQRLEGLDFKPALRRLQELAGTVPEVAPRRVEKKKVAIHPVPDSAPAAAFRHRDYGEPAKVWTYKDAAGQVLGHVARFNLAEGGKAVLPRSWTAEGWAWVSFSTPRPLYGLELLRPTGTAVLVEGEKAADACRQLLPGCWVGTWPGGGKAAKHADFKPLAGRKLILWPDLDLHAYPDKHVRAGEVMPPLEQPGLASMLEVAEAAEKLGCEVRIFWPPASKVDGWDAADALAEGWTPERTRGEMKKSIFTTAELLKRLAPPPAGPPVHEEVEGDPVQALGHDHGRYHYLARGARQVLALAGGSHTKQGLLMLAPLHYWEREYPSKDGVHWLAAANAMIRRCEARGVFLPDRVRGRGVWMDEGRVVVHLGDRLLVDGAEVPVMEFKSHFIYEASGRLDIGTSGALDVDRARRLAELCRLLPWAHPAQGLLLAGWLVVAQISGALKWRPHIWVTGPAGSGKSWTYDMILSRCLGRYAVAAAAETTSAGLRQHLGRDARPVIIDEVEGTDSSAQGRIQGVLALARQSSSGGGKIWKGTTAGDAMGFEVKACFAFCSINVGLKEHADATRTSVLTFTPDAHGMPQERADRFEQVIKPLQAGLLTPEFIAGLQARAIRLTSVIVRNAETLAAAGASPNLYGSRRAGDQIGTLMAGAHALLSDELIAPESAEEYLRREAPPVVVEAADDSPDEQKLLARIFQSRARLHNGTAQVEYTLGDLARRVSFCSESDLAIPKDEALRHLRMHGIRVEATEVWFSNTHTGLAKLLAGSTWAHNWGATLARLPGARPLPPKSYGTAGLSRGQALPLEVVFPGVDSEVES